MNVKVKFGKKWKMDNPLFNGLELAFLWNKILNSKKSLSIKDFRKKIIIIHDMYSTTICTGKID